MSLSPKLLISKSNCTGPLKSACFTWCCLFEISDFGFKFELVPSSEWIGCRIFKRIAKVEIAQDSKKVTDENEVHSCKDMTHLIQTLFKGKRFLHDSSKFHLNTKLRTSSISTVEELTKATYRIALKANWVSPTKKKLATRHLDKIQLSVLFNLFYLSINLRRFTVFNHSLATYARAIISFLLSRGVSCKTDR